MAADSVSGGAGAAAGAGARAAAGGATAVGGSGRAALAVLDLVPISSGSTSGEALRNSVDLAQHAEAAGYARYWLAEHHLNPGIAGSAPHTLIAALAAATERIRIGTAATIIGNYEPIQVAEAFGTAAGLYGPRFDLGLGRSGLPRPKPEAELVPEPALAAAGGAASAVASATTPSAPGAPAVVPSTPAAAPTPAPAARAANRVIDGLVIPPRFPFPVDRERFTLQFALFGRTPGDGEKFESTVNDLLSFFEGDYLAPNGGRIAVHPAEHSGVSLWIHGSTGGESARIAGSLGLPYGANYHVAPAGVIESVTEYRAQFVPGRLKAPHVIVSVDVVVADTTAEAERLAQGYGAWVDSIRRGSGAIPYPSPDEARANPLDAEATATVQDRLDTRFVGDPATVVERLETLQRVTGADELLVTTITHDHAARVRSYELLAEAWL